MIIEKGQIWINEENPHLSIKITDIGIIFDETDEGLYCIWSVYDEKAWDEFVLKKKFNGIGTLKEHIKNGKNTYPYSFCGECSIRSIKQKIRNNQLILLKEENI